MKYTARLPESNVNVTPTSPLREFFVLLLGAIGIIVGIYFFLGLAVNFVVPRISPEIEQKIAGPLLNSMAGSDNTSEKAKIVQTLIDKLQGQCAKLPYQLTVYLHDSPLVNAVALPGGNVVVFSGLLEKVESENELAFVLSHEMGHYVNRDHLRGLGRALIFMTLSAILFGPDSSIGNLLARSLDVTEMGFSRKQETLADEFGLDILYCNYGHVGGATDFFNKIRTENNTSRLGHYFSTHPQNQKRILHLRNYSRSKGFSEKSFQNLPNILSKKASVDKK